MKINARRKELEAAFVGVNIKALADKLNANRAYVYNIKYGHRTVSGKRARQIEELTTAMGHKVPREVLRPDIFGN